MNEKISWDSSLVKKFSSSNHFKLLNQLRTEVKMYPLSNKKIISKNVIKDNKLDTKTDSQTSNSKDMYLPKSTKTNNDKLNNQCTVNFNNSKNFSIYNNNSYQQQETTIKSNEIKSDVESTPSSFKDRLDQIDMK